MSKQQQSQVTGSPISDEAYDVLAALHNKLEALDVYETYAEDGPKELWGQLSQLDTKAVTLLVDQLEQLVRDGRLRAAA